MSNRLDLAKKIVASANVTVRGKTVPGYITLGAAATGIVGVAYLMLRNAPLPTCLLKQKRTLHYLLNPGDLWSLGTFYFTHKLPSVPTNLDDNWAFVYKKLLQTSRSFAAVILELHEELRNPIAIFYLVLRALDSIEDDMNPIVKDTKAALLIDFHNHLEETDGEKPHEVDLLKNYAKVVEATKELKPEYRAIITDICKQMGAGMAKYLVADVVTVADWEEYCFYVAGLVGYGLSRLFAASKLESPSFGTIEMDALSKSMGLFLQKTNIIRDVLEDITQVESRLFWPSEVYSTKGIRDPKQLLKYSNKETALICLNELITDAMKHALQCLNYLQMINDPTVFAFCAIPQTMAIATLALCYNNYDVFLYEVKIPKGEAVRLILNSKNYPQVAAIFHSYSEKILKAVPENDPSAAMMKSYLATLIDRCSVDSKQ